MRFHLAKEWLKDKLGTRSLPSAEIEFHDARGWLVGEDGQGMAPLVHNLNHARQGPTVSPEMQCLGGNGYSEASGTPRLVLDAAVHPIWEGSGNVVALNVLRVMAKTPEAVSAFLNECALARGTHNRLDAHLNKLPDKLAAPTQSSNPQAGARRFTEDLAVGFIASMLVRFSIPAVADAYWTGRLGPDRGLAYGTLPADADTRPILDRALPA